MKIQHITEVFLSKLASSPHPAIADEAPHYAVVHFSAHEDDGGRMFDGGIDIVAKQASHIHIEIRWPLSLMKIPGALKETHLHIDSATGHVKVETTTLP